MKQTVWPRVQTILADILQLSAAEITASTSPDTIEAWDSLNHLNLVLAMEEAFHVQFTPEEIEQLASARHVAELLERKLEAGGHRP